MILIFLPFLLGFVILTIYFAISKRWIPLILMLAIPATIMTMLAAHAKFGPTRMLTHTFPSGGTLKLNYEKPYGFRRSLAGQGELVFLFEKGIITRRGVLLNALNSIKDTTPAILSNNGASIIIRDRSNDKGWLFQDDGSMIDTNCILPHDSPEPWEGYPQRQPLRIKD